MKGSSWQVWSALYGMGASIAITALLSYGVVRAEKAAANDPKKSMGILYVGAVQRFLLVLGLFIFGLAVLKLEPLATAVSFGLTQFGYVFNFAQLKKNSI